ncbi:barstar family protein [Allostreptomyces psammosilenae]|uniref:barstar family protein n=1 Tax=Allostreptomyces psammosilenae TaxID=1892865 RepID=UPI0015CDD214
MRDAPGLFAEFDRGLRFPSYFGRNWDALRDCLRDLSWIPARHYLVVVRDSHRLLSAEPGRRSTFFEIMNETGQGWANPYRRMADWGEADSAFNLLLLCPPGEVASLEAMLSPHM